MSQWKKITIRVMRYVTLLLIVGFVALLLIYTSGSNRPFEKVEKSVEASLDKENMKRQDGTALKRNFGLNAADYDGVMYYSSEFSISSEEVLLIKAKSETQTAEISSAIEERIKTRMNDFEVCAGIVAVIGKQKRKACAVNMYFCQRCAGNEKYLEIFNNSL